VESTSALEPGETIFSTPMAWSRTAKVAPTHDWTDSSRCLVPTGSDLGRLCDTVLELVLDEVAEDDLAVLAASARSQSIAEGTRRSVQPPRDGSRRHRSSREP